MSTSNKRISAFSAVSALLTKAFGLTKPSSLRILTSPDNTLVFERISPTENDENIFPARSFLPLAGVKIERTVAGVREFTESSVNDFYKLNFPPQDRKPEAQSRIAEALGLLHENIQQDPRLLEAFSNGLYGGAKFVRSYTHSSNSNDPSNNNDISKYIGREHNLTDLLESVGPPVREILSTHVRNMKGGVPPQPGQVEFRLSH